MIRDAYVMLSQEPWCFTPEQIASLTDWQIENLYAIPAAERSEELRKSMPESKTSASVSESDIGEPGSPSHRNWVISAFVNGPLKMSPEQAQVKYSAQMAQWRASRNGGA